MTPYTAVIPPVSALSRPTCRANCLTRGCAGRGNAGARTVVCESAPAASLSRRAGCRLYVPSSANRSPRPRGTPKAKNSNQNGDIFGATCKHCGKRIEAPSSRSTPKTTRNASDLASWIISRAALVPQFAPPSGKSMPEWILLCTVPTHSKRLPWSENRYF
jgi:hypothetical protein